MTGLNHGRCGSVQCASCYPKLGEALGLGPGLVPALRGFVYHPFPGAPWCAMVGTPGGRPFGLLPPWPRKDDRYRDLGNFPTQEAAFAAAEIALFDAKHPNCCHRCGWALSSHGRSQYGLDCGWGMSPAAEAGHLRIVRLAEERLQKLGNGAGR